MLFDLLWVRVDDWWTWVAAEVGFLPYLCCCCVLKFLKLHPGNICCIGDFRSRFCILFINLELQQLQKFVCMYILQGNILVSMYT